MYVTKEAIERVRSSQDLVSVIESRGVALTREGRNFGYPSAAEGILPHRISARRNGFVIRAARHG